MMSYLRFAAMIAASTTLMYGLMYLNTERMSHVHFSQTRLWMAMIMGGAMAAVMMGSMKGMYENKRVNAGVVLGGLILVGVGVWGVRSQETVGDIAYMRAMIPHHSIAVLTSERAQITDPRVRDLADRIISAQLREIDEMERLIEDLRRNRPPVDAPRLEPAERSGAPRASKSARARGSGETDLNATTSAK